MAKLLLPGLTGSIQYASDAITKNVFGANFLFDRDGGQEAGTISNTYESFAEEVNLGTMRYPGGTITEVNLDLANPNSLDHDFSDINGTPREANVGISSFLDFAGEIGSSATIVLPTYRFLSESPDATGNRTIDTAYENDLRGYVQFVLSEAKDKGVNVSAFEIGNEWFVDNSRIFGFRMSAVEYGRVAAYLAVVVQEEIKDFNASVPATQGTNPDVVIQVGPGGEAEWCTPEGRAPTEDYSGDLVATTKLIFDQFSTPESRAAVDGILAHRYLTGNDSQISGWVYQPFEVWKKMAAATSGFADPRLYVTEWNVAARNAGEQGLKQFDSMVEMVEEMAIAGVDHANVWAVQQNNKTRLINNSGIGEEAFGGLSLAGIAFDMMSAQLQGTRVIAGPSSLSDIAVNSFGSAGKNVYFLTNRSETGRLDSFSVSSSTSGVHHVTIYEVTLAEDGSPTVKVTTLNIPSETTTIPLNFSANETMMIVVARGKSGTTIEGYDQADVLAGSKFDDLVSGGTGNDTLSGESGNDRLDGEFGDDSIYGSAGNDVLLGGDGSDRLEGGVGNDTLIGGAGNDVLIGGAGVDVVSYATATQDIDLRLQTGTPMEVAGFGADCVTEIEGLEGGSGNDRLTGDAGANILLGGAGDDRLDGGAGNDTLVGGAGTDAASYTGATAGVTVNLTLTTAQATGGAGTDMLSQVEDLIGSGYNDVLTGNTGANRIDGGVGRDTITGGGGADTVLGGDGDDLFVGSTLAEHAAGEQIIGGAGTDELRFASTAAGTLVLGAGVDVERVVIGTGTGLSAVTTATTAINLNAAAMQQGVTLVGNAGSNQLTGTGFNDRLEGGVGNDTLIGGAGNDVLIGGAGVDVVSYATATQDLDLRLQTGTPMEVAGFGTDSVTEIEGLEGGSGNDRLAGDAGANILLGGAGDDRLDGGAGNDTLVGGAGTDAASYTGATSGVTVNLTLTTAQATGGAGTDMLSQIEDLAGSGYNDVLTGNVGSNRIDGGVGRDTIIGGGGADTVLGGDGDDLFVISTLADHAAGEQIIGGGGADELRFTSTVAGTLVLGAGVDVERVVIGTGTGLSAVTTATTAININAEALHQGVTLVGNAGSNRLTGTNFDDRLEGGVGSDVLAGGGGDDLLVGGAGNDVITGGDGADRFVFPSTSGGIDVINDFNQLDGGADDLDVLYFAGIEVGTFDYIGSAAFTGGLDNSEARVLGNQVLVDANGDGRADITITLTGLTYAAQLEEDDFLFC